MQVPLCAPRDKLVNGGEEWVEKSGVKLCCAVEVNGAKKFGTEVFLLLWGEVHFSYLWLGLF